MNKKANGTFREILNARGYEQVERFQYDRPTIALPVTNYMSICIIMVLALITGWVGNIVDMNGAFLHGEFEEDAEPIYMGVPEVFEKMYRPTGNVHVMKYCV